MKKPRFVNNAFYHIYNRGVDKRKIFLNDEDYFRFIHDLFEFNDEAAALNLYYKRPSLQSYEVEPRKILLNKMIAQRVAKRRIIVEIIAFCLMPNHFHIFMRQHRDNGIVKFMQKLGTGYTMYFNQKYERVGALFQGRFKAVHIKREPHFIYLPYYIHLNPLDLAMPSWREKKISNVRGALQYLASYRWSSYLDYIGKKNFPSILHRDLVQKLYRGPDEYRRSFYKWIQAINMNAIADIVLE